MKIKDAYTFEELCTGLTIPLTKFCQMAGITEPTLIRLRKGYSGRQHTINSILATFSKVYLIDLDLSNVSGLTVQDKPHQKGKKPSTSIPTIDAIPKQEAPQISNVEPKRIYVKKNKEKKSTLPDGCILATDFAKQHGLPRETFRDHMIIGLGPGVPWGMGNEMTVEKEHVDYSERQNPSRPKEKERYLTPEQQDAALKFWDRHGVPYQTADDTKENE